jgi:hypothetical protein
MAEKVYKGGCYCGGVSWEVTGKPILSAYCHCTLCQRLTGEKSITRKKEKFVPFTHCAYTGCPFVHTIHFPATSFKWTQKNAVDELLDSYVIDIKPWKKRWRCKKCGACIASFHEKRDRWSVWGSHFERDEGGRIKGWEDFKPAFHMFYGTKIFEVEDGLSKWSGYPGESERLDWMYSNV